MSSKISNVVLPKNLFPSREQLEIHKFLKRFPQATGILNNPTTTKQLAVYLNKMFVGIFAQNSSGGGALSFSYDVKYLKSVGASKLSISLPLRSEAFDDKTTRAFFSGLLPDGEQLTLVAKQLKSSEKNPFALLSQIGHDCAGAIEILPLKEKPPTYKQGSSEALSTDQLCKILAEIRTNPLLAGARKIRLSLAGAQSKLAVFFDEKKNSLPELVKNKPSTHILKPAIASLPDSSHNEFFCMKLAKEMGFGVAEVFLKFAKEKPYLLIRRFDRIRKNKLVTRIHQEDFCQALGLPPEFKYQGVDGGPGILKCLELIEKNSARPSLDKIIFTRAIIFNYFIGNCDAHGKNFSFLYQKNDVNLAPLYDLVCTAIYKNLNHKMAMKIGRVFDPERLLLAHWHAIIANNNTAKSNLNKELKTFAEKLPIAAKNLQKKLQKNGISSPVFDDIIAVINKRAARILGYF